MSEPTSDAQGGQQAAQTPNAAPAAPAPDGAQPPPAGQQSQWRVEDLPEGAQKMIRELREEAGTNRTKAKTAEQQAAAERQELIDGIARALNLKQDDAPPDPTALQQAVTERESRIGSLETRVREQDVELAAWRAATTAGANVTALLDSRSFVSAIAKLDPAGDDFAGHLDAAVKAALTANPTLRADRVLSAGAAGIGAVDSSQRVEARPGIDRMRQAYAGQQ